MRRACARKVNISERCHLWTLRFITWPLRLTSMGVATITNFAFGVPHGRGRRRSSQPTRLGARALGLGRGRAYLEMHELPLPLQGLSPDEVESFFCIYKGFL